MVIEVVTVRKYIIFLLIVLTATIFGCTKAKNVKGSIVNNSSFSSYSSNTESSMVSSSAKVSANSEITSGEYIYTVQDGNVKLQHFNGDESNVTIPEQLDGKPVKVLGEDSFYQKTNMKTIIISDSVTTIENSAFYRCYSLESITIPTNIQSIGDNPFFRCSSLSKISVEPENNNYCDIDGVLYTKDKSELVSYPEAKTQVSYTIPEGVKKIGNDAFGYRPINLKNLTIPSTVSEVPDFNFPDDVTLFVKANSAAEKSAKEKGLQYKVY